MSGGKLLNEMFAQMRILQKEDRHTHIGKPVSAGRHWDGYMVEDTVPKARKLERGEEERHVTTRISQTDNEHR